MFSWNNFLGKLTNNLLGIVNITNDSFSDDGLLNKQEKIPEVYETALKKGINFVDIGCVSTKPNFKSITTEEELLRLNSFLEHKNDNFYHSIDTFNPIVAEEAFQNNFSVVNDVSGGQDQRMITTLRKHSVGLILTHRNKNSSSIHDKVDYKDIVKDVKNDLMKQVENILETGVNRDQIAIDVGLGFGKTQEQSATLFESIGQFVGDYPLVIGYSRKKFTKLLKTSDEELLNHCQNQGVSLVRLHFID